MYISIKLPDTKGLDKCLEFQFSNFGLVPRYSVHDIDESAKRIYETVIENVSSEHIEKAISPTLL